MDGVADLVVFVSVCFVCVVFRLCCEGMSR